MADSPHVTQLVALGASAGGVEALSALVATLPADFPAPLVVAQHLDPTRPSHLQEILTRRCPLPVRTVVDQAPLEAGIVYVVPADRHISLDDHHLRIVADGVDHPKPSIDRLFRSAAAVFGEGLIAVVLSGLGSDGAAGARYVKEAGGTVVIQNPRTAPYPSMPQALAPTTVDVIADVDAMGPLLRDLLKGTYVPSGPREDRAVRAFLAELREHSGVDFSQYKELTIQRRLQRRMVATGTSSLEEYRTYLRSHEEEYGRLVAGFLIKVTTFFRDPALFAHLRAVILPALVEENRGRDKALRLWSAGCATGEEAYSLALLVAEALGEEMSDWTVRIFATDLDRDAIAFARRGVYPTAALEGVPPDLVAHYLVALDGAYEVSKLVRGLLVFGEHDLGQRPPFPHLDLCLCRNVLIYFTPELQRRALEMLAFALRDGGYLALGQAESAGPAAAYFAPVHGAVRLYRREGARLALPGGAARPPERAPRMPAQPAARELARVREEAWRAQRRQLATEQLLLGLPVGVAVVDRRYDLQRLNGAARRLLGLRGEALGEDLMHQLAGLAPEDARALRAALDAALRGEARTLEAVPSTAAEPGATRYLRIVCQPAAPEGGPPDNRASAGGSRLARGEGVAVLVITDATEAVATRQEMAAARAEAARLETANTALREAAGALQAANEELAGTNALLRRANEETVLGSEEVQAAAEEVETLNEELQATNEDLETTNSELQARHLEARELAAAVEEQRRWLAAILSSMGEAVVVLDAKGRTIFSNAFVDEMFGPDGAGAAFAPQDAEGRPLVPEATPQERARRGESFRMEFTRQDGQHRRRWYEATARPVHGGADGAAPGGGDSVLVIRDITDRTLRQLQDTFLAIAGHELRTPLTPISGYLGLLVKGLTGGAQEPERLAGYARAAEAEMARLQGVIEALLDAAQLAGGPLSLELGPVDLATMVGRAVDLVRPLAEGRSLTLERTQGGAAPEAPLVVDGEAERLEQVVLNLLINALTHAPGAAIAVRLGRAGSTAELAVRDEGPGIAPEAQAQLFTRFYQAARDASGDVATRGLGLGLYMAREIVEAHGGTLTLASEPGQGATFTVRLPLLPARSATGAPAGRRPVA